MGKIMEQHYRQRGDDMGELHDVLLTAVEKIARAPDRFDRVAQELKQIAVDALGEHDRIEARHDERKAKERTR